MQWSDIKNYPIPSSPGVYIFIGGGSKKLYIGKATSLRERIRSYFGKELVVQRGEHIARMVQEAKSIKWHTTPSVLEAVVLEAAFIKKYKPFFNTKEKDDKSFNYVVITDEDFPRVLLVRERQLFIQKRGDENMMSPKYVFGPFPHGGVLKEALKTIRKIFPFRDKCTWTQRRGRKSTPPCFNRQIGLCPGVCTGEISKREYAKRIQNIRMFFEGKSGALIKKLEREMYAYAQKMEFERAAEIKKTIFALKHIKDISLLKDDFRAYKYSTNSVIEAYDIAHLSGTDTVGAMVAVAADGEPMKERYRRFKVKSVKGVNDTKSLREVLARRISHFTDWGIPSIVVVDGGVAQKNIAEDVLREAGVEIPVVGVVKDGRHKPKEVIGDKKIIGKYKKAILLANAEAHRFAVVYHRKTRRKRLR